MASEKTPGAQAVLNRVEVRDSGIHGSGAFAKRAIRANVYVGPYMGRRYTAQGVGRKAWDPALTYVFGLPDGSFLDASEGGNDTRFINHSCEPNCIATESERPGCHVEIWSTRPIRKGEELLLDYELDIAGNDPSLYVCRCAARRCRGTMLARG